MYSILLAVGIHHREMIQRKSLNYERILNVEIEKTNVLISKLVPFHMVNVIKNEKRQVDEFDDVTLLYTDMVGFTNFSKNVKDPREVVNLLSKLFSRFDQLCEENKVYKVHTIGDCYVIMGYNGKIDKSKRFRGVVVDEANRVIQTGLEMIDIIREVRETSDENQGLKDLDMRIGIHTGKVVAGIIGSKVVRYDIFGEGVLIANKMESNGVGGKVCVSEDTRKILMQQQDIINEYQMEEHKTINLHSINKSIKSYTIERKERDSIESNMLSSAYGKSLEQGSKNSKSEADLDSVVTSSKSE
jgi:class 3 adenylate cyclase